MSEKETTKGEHVLGEADVAEILERAIRLDGIRDARVTIEQVREAALEVGVSPAAFSQALTEFAEERSAPAEPSTGPLPRPRVPSIIRTGVGVAFGATLGAIAGFMDGPYLSEETVALAAILLGGASLSLVLAHKREKALLPYIIDVIWLWASFTVAAALATNALGDESIVFTVLGIILASVVGGWVLKMTGKDVATETTRTVRLEITAPKEDQTG
jgi:hypothetical protein